MDTPAGRPATATKHVAKPTRETKAQRPTLLVISQVYVPDPASVGQHMADAAAELARRGYRVLVFTSARGYEDPTQQYPAQEVLDEVEVRRLPFSSFGKRSIALRLLGAAVFLAQVLLRALLLRRLDGLLVSTSPPIMFWMVPISPTFAPAFCSRILLMR